MRFTANPIDYARNVQTGDDSILACRYSRTLCAEAAVAIFEEYIFDLRRQAISRFIVSRYIAVTVAKVSVDSGHWTCCVCDWSQYGATAVPLCACATGTTNILSCHSRPTPPRKQNRGFIENAQIVKMFFHFPFFRLFYFITFKLMINLIILNILLFNVY